MKWRQFLKGRFDPVKPDLFLLEAYGAAEPVVAQLVVERGLGGAQARQLAPCRLRLVDPVGAMGQQGFAIHEQGAHVRESARN